MSSDNVSDALRKRAGTDLSDFDDESLSRLYSQSLMGPKYKGDDWDERKKDQYIEEYGTIAYNKMRDEIDYEAIQGLGGDQDDWQKYAKDGSGNWNTVRQAVGISNLNSRSDLEEMYKKVNDEYQKRMIGAGLDGYAKTEDLEKLKGDADNAEPIEYNKSETLKSAEDNVSKFNNTKLNNQGSNTFGKQVQSGMSELGIGEFGFNPEAQGYADKVKNAAKDVMSEAGVVTRGPNMGAVTNGTGFTTEGDQTFDYDDTRKDLGNDYTDEYKLRISKNLKPVNRDGSPRSSKAYNVKKKLLNANAFNGGY